jgi:hypothetical protein
MQLRYALVYKGRRYPPKLVLGWSVERVTGIKLAPDEYSGGLQTNSALTRLGFRIVLASGRDHQSTRSSYEQTLEDFHETSEVVSKQVRRRQSIARIVLKGRSSASLDVARGILIDVFTKFWPAKTVAKFTVTPGGFIAEPFPQDWAGSMGWHSSPDDLKVLKALAKRAVVSVMKPQVLRAIGRKTRILTLGLDLKGTSASPAHCELVAVYDVGKRRVVRWTGKSYPTQFQEATLVQVSGLQTHFMRIGDERILLLGCHDLNMFSPRSRATQSAHGPRRRRCDAMAKLVKNFKPKVVLHHPHHTDSPNIWRLGWNGLIRSTPSIAAWVSGIRYSHWAGRPRRPLEKVLSATAHNDTDVLDIIVQLPAALVNE